MDIAEVARQSGFTASALRYYEEKGLIQSSGRHGLRRLFDPDVLVQLSLISLGQAAGFTLDEIAGLLEKNGKPAIDRTFISNKADELDRKIRQLTALRDGLRHVATCTAPSHMECPKFQRLLRVATVRRSFRKRGKLKPLNR